MPQTTQHAEALRAALMPRSIGERATLMRRTVVGEARNRPFEMAYTEFGDTDSPAKMLFVHGLWSTGAGYEPLVEAVEAAVAAAGGRVPHMVLFDNRGVGQSGAPGGRWTSSEFALDAWDLCAALGWHDGVRRARAPARCE